MADTKKTKVQLLEEIAKLESSNRSLEKRLKCQQAKNITLKKGLQKAATQQKEINAVLACARAVLKNSSFHEAAREIFDVCRKLIGAQSGYVALLDEKGQENEVLFLESGGLPCKVNPDLPMPIRGLRSEAYRKSQAVYHNNFIKSEWVGYLPEGHVILDNVLFAPLVDAGKAVGLIGLANKKGGFTADDARRGTAFGEITSIALQNSRNLDLLTNALQNIKVLRGLLPICAQCKKIRDDKGYWNQLEQYLHAHSEVKFTHGICPDCMKELYPALGKSSS